MSIENNYEGPPSLKIYQEFVKTANAGSLDQNAVIIAKHYDVHNLNTASKEEYKLYSVADSSTHIMPWYVSGKGESLGVKADAVKGVDMDSVKVHFKDAWVSQGSVSGITIKEDSNEIDLGVDIIRNDTLEEVVTVGDVVMVECEGTKTVASIIAFGESSNDVPATIESGESNTGTASLNASFVGTVSRNTSYYIDVKESDAEAKTAVVSITDMGGASVDASCQALDGTIVLGTTGITVKYTGDLVVGDRYMVTVYPKETVKDVLYLNRIIKAKAGSDATVSFGKARTFEPKNYTASSVGVDLTNICADVVFGDEEHNNAQIIKGEYFVEFRVINYDYVGKLGYVTPSTASIVGEYCLENPMGVMVNVALKGGKGVYFTAVEDDTFNSYRRALVLLSKSTSAYGVVLGTTDKDIVMEAAEFVKQCADPDVANYKIMYYGLDANPVSCVFREITDSKGNKQNATATLNNGVLTLNNSSVDGFITSGVLRGDIVHMWGKEYEVDQVLNNTTLEITDSTATVDRAADIMVTRKVTDMALVEELKSRVYTNSHRCYCVFGDGITIDSIENAPAWLLAALPAGMRAGEYCHRPISNLSYDGVEANNTLELNAEQLRALASRGVWILANTADGKQVYNYHQLSTDMSDKKLQEQSYTTNFDNISRGARDLMQPYYGNSNISQEFLNQLHANLGAYLSGKETNAPSVEIGPQLVSYENLTIEQDEVNKDRVYMSVDYVMPAPFNHVVLRQRLI